MCYNRGEPSSYAMSDLSRKGGGNVMSKLNGQDNRVTVAPREAATPRQS